MFVSRVIEKLQAPFDEAWWKGVAWAEEAPIKFWSGSESQGGYIIFFKLKLTSCESAFSLGRGLRSLSALLINWVSAVT